MNIDYLRTFLTLAENGSFSETAKEHIVVQSTVSSRIQELEKELGQSLFIRSYNHAELTLAGQAFLEYAKNIVELENRAIDRIGLVGQFSERLTIGTVYAFHKCYLVQGTRRFLEKHSDISVRIEFGHSRHIISAMHQGKIDGMLIAAMILIGLGGVLFEMPYQSAIAMLTTNDNRPKYYSLNNTITGIASAIGPLLGVALLRLDFKVVCFGAASCFMINFVLSRVAMPPIMRQAKSYAVMPAVKRIAKDRPYQIFVLLMMVFWLGASQIDITYPLRVQEIYGCL